MNFLHVPNCRNRCDRILWKTNVLPKAQSNGRRRPSLRLWSPNPLSGLRRSTSLSRTDTSVSPNPTISRLNDNDGSVSPPRLAQTSALAQIIRPSASRPSSAGHGSDSDTFGVASLLNRLLPRSNDPQSMRKRSKTIDVPPSLSTLNGMASVDILGRKNSDSGAIRAQQKLDNGSLGPGLIASQSEAVNESATTSNAALAMRWLFGWFPGREPSTLPLSQEEKDAAPAPLPIIHQKGDVVCLHYGTLDDAAMRRLEGRSDHRPILGTYQVYV